MIGQTGCDLANRARTLAGIATLTRDRCPSRWAIDHLDCAFARLLCVEPMPEREPVMRASIVDSRLPEARETQQSRESHASRETLIDDLERCCARLFERWCESRRVVPLAYLMHAWPLADASMHPAKRLAGALRDLLHFHADALDSSDRRLIRYALAAAEMATLL
ncbi:hypothetical protein [Paraburkholderia tropica]|uniref:hypothetical protein n=1 Tax=Paraburkholderia tropica TaxID=92647 RepID=UPI001CC5CA6B|nr:hypothetical protein [Paraburkholderia tropica]